MKNTNNALAYVINIHQRLSRDFPETPYKQWCDWVHSQSFSLKEKWDRILCWKLNPSEYSNPQLFRYDWQLYKLLSKFSEGGTPTDDEKSFAFRKFCAAEERCSHVNQYYRSGTFTSGTWLILSRVRKIIYSILGDASDFIQTLDASTVSSKLMRDRFSRYSVRYTEHSTLIEYDSPVNPKYGPGVSVGADSQYSVRNSEESISAKLQCGTVTASAAPWGTQISRVWKVPTSRIVRGSRLTYVVKRVGEARTICYEPSTNMLIQKMVGQYIRKRLKAVCGIDLRDQTRNRNLAQLGSLTDSWATMDLSSASDLFATQFVMETLPFEWFSLLDDIRSKFYQDPKTSEWVPFEKFSTMGNGFTFELETLLFAAIVMSSTTIWGNSSLTWADISVYGDDLVFPKEYFRIVEQSLLLCGHLPNHEKSFSSGPFRESCGGDFFNGWNVTPVKIEEVSLDDPQTIVNIYNGLFIRSRSDCGSMPVDDRFSRALSFIKSGLQRNYPKLSDGPVELFHHPKSGLPVLQPSNRWLWTDETPKSRTNQAYSRAYHSVVPKWLLTEKVRKVLEYEVPIEAAGYMAQHGGSPAVIEERSFAFVRNPALSWLEDPTPRFKPGGGKDYTEEPAIGVNATSITTLCN